MDGFGMAVMDGSGSVRLVTAGIGKHWYGSHGEAWQAETWAVWARNGRNEDIERGEEV